MEVVVVVLLMYGQAVRGGGGAVAAVVVLLVYGLALGGGGANAAKGFAAATDEGLGPLLVPCPAARARLSKVLLNGLNRSLNCCRRVQGTGSTGVHPGTGSTGTSDGRPRAEGGTAEGVVVLGLLALVAPKRGNPRWPWPAARG